MIIGLHDKWQPSSIPSYLPLGGSLHPYFFTNIEGILNLYTFSLEFAT